MSPTPQVPRTAEPPGSPAARTAKRALDVAVALVGLLALSPLAVVLGLSIAATMGRPVLFCQLRPGQHGRPFRLLKFRTMRPLRDRGTELSDAARVTRLGGFLRRASLDEIPQLLNVLRGELSLVGPRPLLMEYLPLYSPAQARRHDVRPGITGWAQVNGRDALNWDERFALDRWYVDHWSLMLDLRILGLTAWCVITGAGTARGGAPIAEEWRGNPGTGTSSAEVR
jgi:lipopolysaccharide/colanic/teichoic acid biosynthesis glycosyltransferase